jgi:hypothetical protein
MAENGNDWRQDEEDEADQEIDETVRQPLQLYIMALTPSRATRPRRMPCS